MSLPKLLYVYEETYPDDVSDYVASVDPHEQKEGLVGLYELRKIVEVRHKKQFREGEGKWVDGKPL